MVARQPGPDLGRQEGRIGLAAICNCTEPGIRVLRGPLKPRASEKVLQIESISGLPGLSASVAWWALAGSLIIPDHAVVELPPVPVTK